jgi:hypothetical protein
VSDKRFEILHLSAAAAVSSQTRCHRLNFNVIAMSSMTRK